MSMNKPPSLTAAALALVALVTAANAGTMFRLEIGPPIAAGNLKDLKKTDKKAVLAVRALVCDDLANVQITGTAEGLVNGARQSLPLVLSEANKAEAIYFVSQQWPDTGAWVLHLKGSCSSPKAEASTLVAVSKATFIREKSEVLREPATKKQVEDALKQLARSQS
jgi:hypothetical protein